MGNPLVAEVKDSTKSYSGVSLLETANDLKSAIDSGEWASVALGSVGTALDALSIAMDPFGAILAAGVGWLIEHVGPLKEALNALTGNADQIAANSETWKNIATELGSVGQDLAAMSQNDTASWTGQAGDAYRQRAADTVALLNSAQQGCDGASNGVKTAGEVVAAVRSLVRDIIAEIVGHLISWALQVVFTLGIGLTWVVPQVAAAVAKTAAQIASITGKLVKALKALMPLVKKAGDLFSDAAKALRGIKHGSPAPSAKPGSAPPGPKGGGTPKGGGSTTPSGDHSPPPPKDDGSPAPSDTPPPKGGGTPEGGGIPKGGAPKGGGTPKGSGTPKAGDGSTAPSGSGSKGGGTPKDTPKSPNKPNDPGERKTDAGALECKSDPVDIASGDVVMTEIDLVLPGLPELQLERTHISSYRAGGWFGPSWASTVDQRLEVDAENICYFSPGGMILVYPLPSGDSAVLPVVGPRLPLVATENGYRLDDPIHRQQLFFGNVPGSRDGLLPLVSVERDDGDRIDIDHTDYGAPYSVWHSAGYLVRLHSNATRITEIEVLDPDGRFAVSVARFGYNKLGQLTQVANSSGKPLNYDYDRHDRMVGWQDRNGTWYRYVYDADGRCVRTVGEQGFYNGSFGTSPQRGQEAGA
jgi:YD repeat-containing protein